MKSLKSKGLPDTMHIVTKCKSCDTIDSSQTSDKFIEIALKFPDPFEAIKRFYCHHCSGMRFHEILGMKNTIYTEIDWSDLQRQFKERVNADV